MTINKKSYQAARSETAYYHQANAGFLRLRGADRVDFIQRQSTNDLRKLAADQFVSTVLTSPTARILDVFHVVDEGATLGLITLPGRNEASAKFLRNRIFFSDQVEVQDLSAAFEQVLIFGPQAAKSIQLLGVEPPDLGRVASFELAESFVHLLACEILVGCGYLLLFEKAILEAVFSILRDSGVEAVDADVFEILRVESGMPGPIRELTEDFTPLEVGIQAMVSDAKGCYTGQEIIARQITYDKVTKKIVGLKLDGVVQSGNQISIDGKSVGVLTSVVDSPRLGVIGLGVLRRQYTETGQHVTVRDQDESAIKAVVTSLPFTQ